jgi:hypothetical protein
MASFRMHPRASDLGHLLCLICLVQCGGQIGSLPTPPPSPTCQAPEPRTNSVDQRFGGGGHCALGHQMQLGWFFNWGHGKDYPNQVEIESCAELYPEQQQMLTVGKPDNTEDYDLEPLKTEYLANEEETAAYAELEALVVGKYTSTDSVLASYLLIPMYAEAMPGAFYQIANEPDWSPYFTPEDYATHFELFSSRIRQYDPTARIVIGGIAWSRYNHPMKWRTKELIDPATMPEPLKTAIAEHPESKAMLEQNAWVYLWIQAYREQYGTAPAVDVWAIHPYSWLEGDQAWQGIYDADLAIADTQESVESFRAFLDSAFVEASDKPLWLTEFSPGQNASCADFADCNAKALNVIAYQDGLLPWLAESKLAQKWFWFVLRPTPWTGELFTSFMFANENGELNDAAANYVRLAETHRDRKPPIIEQTALTALPDKTNARRLIISANDLDSGVARYAYGFYDSSDKTVGDWTTLDAPGETLTSEIVPPADAVTLYVRVQDHAGNEATECTTLGQAN